MQQRWAELKVDYALKYLDSMTQGIREGAERARKIVRDLRVFARSQDDVWQPVDLHEDLESSLTLLNHLLKDRITIHRKFGDLPPVECVRSQIDQVFLNLLANAAQAIPPRARSHRDTTGQRHRGDRDQRHGPGNRAGEPRPHLRPVLHDQAGREGTGSACRSATRSSRSTGADSRGEPARAARDLHGLRPAVSRSEKR